MPTLGEAVVYINGNNRGLTTTLAGAKQQTQVWAQSTAQSVNQSIGQTMTGGIRNLTSSITSMLGQIGLATMGLQALAGAARGVGNTLGVGLLMEMEDVRAQFMAFYKDGALVDQTLADIRKEANATPFAFSELAKAAAGLGPAARQAQMPLMDLVREAEILGASNPAQGLEGAAFALREAVSGDFTSIIERFNLPRSMINDLKAQGVPNIEIVRRAMRAMGYDMDLVSAKSKTLAGRWSTFMDSIDTIRMTAAQPIFDALGEGLDWIAGLLNDNADAVTAFAQRIAGGFRGAIQTLKDVGKAFLDLAGYLSPNNKTDLMRAWFGPDVGPRIDEVVRTVKSGVDQAVGFARGLWDAVFGRNITGTTEYGEQWTRHVAGIWDNIKAAFAKGGLGGVAKYIQDALATEWGKIDWAQVWTKVTVTAQAVAGWFVGAAGAVLEWAKSLWPTANQWASVWSSVQVTAATVGQWFLGAAAAVLEWAKSLWPTPTQWGEIWQGVVVTAQMVSNWFTNAAKAFSDWLRDLPWQKIWEDAGISVKSLVVTVAKLVIRTTDVNVDTTTTDNAGASLADSLADAYITSLARREQDVYRQSYEFGAWARRGIADSYKQRPTEPGDDGISRWLATSFGIWKGMVAVGFRQMFGPGVMSLAGFIEGLTEVTAAFQDWRSKWDPLWAEWKAAFAEQTQIDLDETANQIGRVFNIGWRIEQSIKELNAGLPEWRSAWSTYWKDFDWGQKDMAAALTNLRLTLRGWEIDSRIIWGQISDGVNQTVTAIVGFLTTLIPEGLRDLYLSINQELALQKVRFDIWARDVLAPIQKVIDKFNELKGTITNAVTPKSPYLYEPSTPGNTASGTPSWRGGWTWVGEVGPELVRLPRGSQVLPSHQVGRLADGTASLSIDYGRMAQAVRAGMEGMRVAVTMNGQTQTGILSAAASVGL